MRSCDSGFVWDPDGADRMTWGMLKTPHTVLQAVYAGPYGGLDRLRQTCKAVRMMELA